MKNLDRLLEESNIENITAITADINQNPNNSTSWLVLADAYQENGQDRQSMLATCLGFMIDDFSAVNYLADVLYQTEGFDIRQPDSWSPGGSYRTVSYCRAQDIAIEVFEVLPVARRLFTSNVDFINFFYPINEISFGYLLDHAILDHANRRWNVRDPSPLIFQFFNTIIFFDENDQRSEYHLMVSFDRSRIAETIRANMTRISGELSQDELTAIEEEIIDQFEFNASTSIQFQCLYH